VTSWGPVGRRFRPIQRKFERSCGPVCCVKDRSIKSGSIQGATTIATRPRSPLQCMSSFRAKINKYSAVAEMGDRLAVTFDNGWQEPLNGTDLGKFTRKTYLVLRSEQFERQGQRSRSPRTKTCCALLTPPRLWTNRTPSLHITSHKQQTRRFDRCRGVSMSSPGCAGCRD